MTVKISENKCDERILREGNPNVTHITFAVTKNGDDYTIGDVMAERVEHCLSDELLWSGGTAELFICAAKIRQCTINVKYKHTTYELEGEYLDTIENVEIEEVDK